LAVASSASAAVVSPPAATALLARARASTSLFSAVRKSLSVERSSSGGDSAWSDWSSLRVISSSWEAWSDSSPVVVPLRLSMAEFASAQIASACLMKAALL
jgi:hypothetical protein